ncbi:MAG: V-type ATPase subunit [Candidatus Methylomirabilaceae bacterium]
MPDFPYINARVRAMRSRLLPASRLEDLLAAPTLDAFLQALAATPYGPELQEALVRYQGLRAVDAALTTNLQRTTRAILRFADDRPRALIEILLLRWDLANLRAIARGKHAGRPADEITGALVPAGMLGEVVLKEMAGYPDLTGVAGTLESLDHPLAAAMASGVAEYVTTKDLLSVEIALDRGYAAYVLRQMGSAGGDAATLRENVIAETDTANVKTALKLASAGNLPEDRRKRFFTPLPEDAGAGVTEKLFLALSSPQTQAQAWERLRVHGFPVRDLPTDLVAFERALDLQAAKDLAARYLRDPLGLDLIIGYLAMKSAEVANLRLIARGKFLGLPREAVRREMVVV